MLPETTSPVWYDLLLILISPFLLLILEEIVNDVSPSLTIFKLPLFKILPSIFNSPFLTSIEMFPSESIEFRTSSFIL